MRIAFALGAMLLASSISAENQSGSASKDFCQSRAAVRSGMLCQKSGEVIQGMNKICYYNCQGSEAAITVKNYELCPLTITR